MKLWDNCFIGLSNSVKKTATAATDDSAATSKKSLGETLII